MTNTADPFVYISWSDSYILGWSVKDDFLDLYLELHLTSNHSLFEPFGKHEYGCYKLATFTFTDIENMNGLAGTRSPEKDEHMGEFLDLFEIDGFKYPDGELLIDADPTGFDVKNYLEISFKYQDVRAEFVNDFGE